MKNLEKIKREVKNAINNFHFVKERVNYLQDKLGVEIDERPMGSGGVGQIKEMANEIRIQIGYGKSKYNYAMCVIVKKIKNYPACIICERGFCV